MHPDARGPRGLYPLVDAAFVPLTRFPDVAVALVDAGCEFVQLRIKQAPPGGDRERLAVQRAVTAGLARRGRRCVLIVNDRADLARMAAMESPPAVRVGLHLGQTDVAPEAARQIVGPDVILGLSTHTQAQVLASVGEPIDYIGFGPVFGTTSKEGADPTTGLMALAAAVESAAHPVTAIGGLDGERARRARAAGASAVAMISTLYRGLDLETHAGLRALRERAACLHDALR